MNILAERVGGPAATPEMARAVEDMKLHAHRIRSRKLWRTLGVLIAFQFAAFGLVLDGTLPDVRPERVMGGGVLLAAAAAWLLHAWQMRRFRPRCPNCGAQWQMRDLVRDAHSGGSGRCPQCGMPI